MDNEAPREHIIRRTVRLPGGATKRIYWRQEAADGKGGWVERQRYATPYPSRRACQETIYDRIGPSFTHVAPVRLRKRAKPAPAPQPEPTKVAPSPPADIISKINPAPWLPDDYDLPRWPWTGIVPWYPHRTAPAWEPSQPPPFALTDEQCAAIRDRLAAAAKPDGHTPVAPNDLRQPTGGAASVPSFSLTDPIAHTTTVSASPSTGSAVTHTQADLDSLLIRPSEPLLRGTVTVGGSFE